MTESSLYAARPDKRMLSILRTSDAVGPMTLDTILLSISCAVIVSEKMPGSI